MTRSTVRNAHLAESQAEVCAHNVATILSSTSQPQLQGQQHRLAKYPQDVFGTHLCPLLSCVSLGMLFVLYYPFPRFLVYMKKMIIDYDLSLYLSTHYFLFILFLFSLWLLVMPLLLPDTDTSLLTLHITTDSSHPITSHHITSHHNILHPLTSHPIPSHPITPLTTTPLHSTPHRSVPRHHRLQRLGTRRADVRIGRGTGKVRSGENEDGRD